MYDLIVALGGGDDRKVKAVELFKQGMGAHILFTGESTYAIEYANYGVLAAGIVPSFISTDTWGDGDVIREVVNKFSFNHILVVTSNYHIPRASLIIRKDSPKKDFTFVGVPSPFGAKRVWTEFTGYLRALVTK